MVGPLNKQLVFEPDEYSGADNQVVVEGDAIEPDTEVSIALDDSVPHVNADDLWSTINASGANITGQGVVVSIMDTGIDYSHPDLGGTGDRTSDLANVTGGLTGPAIHAVAVKLVWEAASAVNIPVVGIGGIATAADVLTLIEDVRDLVAQRTGIRLETEAQVWRC